MNSSRRIPLRRFRASAQCRQILSRRHWSSTSLRRGELQRPTRLRSLTVEGICLHVALAWLFTCVVTPSTSPLRGVNRADILLTFT